ncbi:MAG: hypothetical protein BGO97_13005 [Micrococcales bacterium 70-64]|nr:DMT family transporter [Leifsonia sp.]ODU64859.1 MAG: hypothetical protein ABT06_13005 [Leifsonia sp. SCN 70-46]OJX86551.1 MAG: hypothetical protein BGO97_13005 [Micrococcales bacterium 70-64]
MLLTVVVSSLAALSYGVSDFLGAVGARRLRVLPGTAVTYAFATATILIGTLIVGGVWSGGAIGWGVAAGVSAITGFLAFYAALAAGPMSLASPLIAVLGSLVPVVVAIALGEQLPWLGWVAVVIALVGGALISITPRGSDRGIPRRTVVLSFVAGVFLGLSIVALDFAPADAGLVPAFLEIATGTVLLGILLVLAPLRRRLAVLDEEQENPPTVVKARLASAFGGVLLGAANALILVGLQVGSLAVVSVIVGLYPVVTIALAAIVHRERLTVVQGVGVALAVAAPVLLAAA